MKRTGQGFSIARSRCCRYRKHGVHHRPRAHVHETPHQRYRSVDARQIGGEEVLDQNDVEVIYHHLAGEKYNRLQPFP